MRKERQLVKELMLLGEVPLLVGEAGIGKTTMIYDIAADLGLPLVDLPVQLMNPEDLLGLPLIKDGKTEFTLPSWFPTRPSVIFLDEINRASSRIRGALLKLLYEKTVAGVRLPEGTLMAAAMNPPTDDYAVDELDDAALLSRLIPVELGVSVKDWLAYMEAKNGNSLVIGFIKAYPEWLLGGANDPLPRPNPRTWEKISKVLNGLSDEVKDEFLTSLLNKMVGVKAQAAFTKFVEGLKSFDPKAVFDARARDSLLALKPNLQLIAMSRALDMALEDPTLDFVGALSYFVDKAPKEVIVSLYRTITEDERYASIKAGISKSAKLSLALSRLISRI